MSIGSFFSREIKFGEAALINDAATTLNTNIPALEALVDADAPQGVAAIVAVIEKADGKVIGPAGAALVNGVLNSYSTDVEPELQALVAQGGTLVPNVVTSLRAVAAKLQAEALATV